MISLNSDIMFIRCFWVFPVTVAEDETRSQHDSEGGNNLQSPSDNGGVISCSMTVTEQNHFTNE